jgi:drug/metabolite transporter (DMT)-like permease
VVYVGIVSSGLGYLTLMTGIQRAGAVMASAFVNLIPVAAILMAAVFLGEPVTLWLAAGAGLVMGAIFYLSKHQHLAF